MINFVPFSLKQNMVLTWWCDSSPYKEYNGVIAAGSIRSGKSTCFSISYMMWAMTSFNQKNFGLCGNTVGSFKRNVWWWLKPWCELRGMKVTAGDPTMNQQIVSYKGKENYFYIFGGHHEGSQKLIQGITLQGCLFDEVALMPESFVNQATGRCSEENKKLWFNCNPDSPGHFFKKNWIDRCAELNILHLHFTMDDNPSLSEKTKNWYKAQYVGIFFKRFVLGLWAVAQGAIYDMWDDANEYDEIDRNIVLRGIRYITVDYGTTNPCVFIDVYDDGDKFWFEREYRYDSRDPKNGGKQKTDAQYADDMEMFIADEYNYPYAVIVDPSAASFKAELRNRGIIVKDADNEVLDGIRMTSVMISNRKFMFNRNKCSKGIEEMLGYVWDEQSSLRGIERPIKVADHYVDCVRYLSKTIVPTWRLSA